MPIESEASRILKEYHEFEKVEARRARKARRAAINDDPEKAQHAEERVLVARERIQAQNLEEMLRKDKHARYLMENDPSRSSKAVVEKHKARKLTLLHQRPTKGMVRQRISVCLPSFHSSILITLRFCSVSRKYTSHCAPICAAGGIRVQRLSATTKKAISA